MRAAHNKERDIMANPFVHVELNTTDLPKAKTFYGSLFGWTLQDIDMGGGHNYTMIGVGDGTGGGMMTHPLPGAPSAWLAYVGSMTSGQPLKRRVRSALKSCASRWK
jgi:predicted enzyme related to lactoylglutathione lyase